MISTSEILIPDFMNAIRLYKANDVTSLRYDRIKTPELKEDQVLINVKAAAITRDELSWPENRLPAIPSYEFSGKIVAVGKDVTNFNINDDVYGLTSFAENGTSAEYIVVSPTILSYKPKTLSHIESAAIPLSALSAWQGLIEHGNLEKGQRVLIHGASGGVGHFAIQIAHELGAYVIGTTSKDNIQKVKFYGADEVIDYKNTQFDQVVTPVDLVFDTTGGDRLEKSIFVIRPDGKLISVAKEPPKEKAKKYKILTKFFVVSPNKDQLDKITTMVDNYKLRPTIDRVYPLFEAQHAFDRIQNLHGAGKIVLDVYHKEESSQSKTVVINYLEKLHMHEFQKASQFLASEIRIIGPAGEAFTNPKEFLVMLEKQKGKYDIKKIFSDDEDVCVLYDFINSKTKAFMISWYHVNNEKINRIQTLFDTKLFN